MRTLLFSPTSDMLVHASTLLVLADGTTLVAWFAGTHEGAADSTIHVLRRCGADSSITAVQPEDPLPQWNPVLAPAPDGGVWLFFKRGFRIDEWTTWVCRSTDAGQSWSSAVELVPGDHSGGRGPVRQQPVLHDGRWLAPGSIEVWDPPRWDSFIDISSDGGGTWDMVMLPLDHAATPGAGCIQPCLVALPDGELVVLTRSTAGAVYRSATRDPYSWPPLQPTGLPNNNSGIAAVALPDGRILAAHNDATDNWGSRSRLLLSISADAGHSWAEAAILEDGTGVTADGRPRSAAASGVVTSGKGEFSYPSMALVGAEVWVSYTWQRRSIAMAWWRLNA